ncbi:MAG: DUF424 family protein [Candidatus Micrarchaeia archaeon]
MFYMKVHENARGRVVAVCDCELIGKVFERGGRKMDLRKYAGFYKGEKVGEDEMLEAIKSFSSLNVVGKNATAFVIRQGLAGKPQVRAIAGIPQAQIYKI